MLFQIKTAFTSRIVCEVEIECRSDASDRVKLGRAVLAAIAKRISLQDADLRGAYLRGADLQGADLRGAYLRGADLRGAYLRGADLRGADLRGADLQGADLRGASAKCLRLITRIGRSDGYEFFAFELEDGTIHVAAGCQSRSMASYRNHVKVDYPARGASDALTAETTDILDFIEKRFAASKAE